jgi:hypothetical protein
MMVVAGDSGGADESSGTVSHALLLKFVEDASKDQPEGGTSNNGQAKEAD